MQRILPPRHGASPTVGLPLPGHDKGAIIKFLEFVTSTEIRYRGIRRFSCEYVARYRGYAGSGLHEDFQERFAQQERVTANADIGFRLRAPAAADR